MSDAPTANPGITRYGRDADLLAVISVRAADPAEGNEAVRTFMERWGQLVQVIIRQACLAFPASYIGRDDLEQEFWIRIVERSGDFQPAPDLGEEQGPRIYGWMRTIAQHLVTDLYRERIKLPLFAIPDEEPTTPVSQRLPIFSTAKPGSPEAVAEQAILAGLSEERQAHIASLRCLSAKDQEVLRRSAPFFVEGQGVDIPDDIKQGIFHDLKTTDDRFRTDRSRAMKRTREHFRRLRPASAAAHP